jgi:hypothetical protein
MSKARKVAVLLDITEAEAREFCLEVQKQVGSPLPSFKAIADCLMQHPEAEGNPSEIARIMREKKTFVVVKRRPKAQRGGRGRGSATHSYFKDFSPRAVQDPRDFIEGVSKCPHGVPRTQRCAICDPKGFREERGWD